MHDNIDLKNGNAWIKETTVGRVIFNSILPDEMEYLNDIIDKKKLTKTVNQVYMLSGNAKTVELLDNLKNLGFTMATKSGVSIAISDILIPENKDDILKRASSQVDDVGQKFDGMF